MSFGFGDMQAALAARDVIERIAKGVVDRMRPAPFMGEVTYLDPYKKTVLVRRAGQKPDEPDTQVNYTSSLAPFQAKTATTAGCIVEVSGTPGNLYVTKIFSGTYTVDNVINGFERDIANERLRKLEGLPTQETAFIALGTTYPGSTAYATVSTFSPTPGFGPMFFRSKGRIKVNVAAWATGNEAVNWYLQMSPDDGANWSILDQSYAHNMGSEQIPLGTFMDGHFAIPSDNSLLRFRLVASVGSGNPMKVGSVAWSALFWE